MQQIILYSQYYPLWKVAFAYIVLYIAYIISQSKFTVAKQLFNAWVMRFTLVKVPKQKQKLGVKPV